MPRIPDYVDSSSLPGSAGLRGGGAQVPAGQIPGVDLGVATLADRAVAGFGQNIGQAGEYVSQIDLLNATKQRAQDVLDGNLALQEYRQQYQAAYTKQAQEGDYRTLPEDAIRIGKDLQHQAMDNLKSPQAKALFKQQAEEFVSLTQARALDTQSARRQQDTLYLMTRTTQQHQEAMAQARTDEERMIAQTDFESTLHQGVVAGLWHGDQAAKVYHDTGEVVKFERAKQENRANPIASYTELKSIEAGGVPTNPAFQNLTVAQLNDLTDDAQKQMHAEVAVAEQRKRQGEAQTKHMQDRQSMLFRNRWSEITPTPQNIPALEALQQEVRTAADKQYLDKHDQSSLLAFGEKYLDIARTPPKLEDDPAIAGRLSTGIALATTPADFQQWREDFAANMGSLKPATITHLSSFAEARQNGQHFTNQPGFRAAKDWIEKASFPEATMAGYAMFATVEERSRYNNAYQALVGWAHDKTPAQIDQEWKAISEDIVRQHIPVPLGQSKLPLPYQRGGSGQGGLVVSEQEAMSVTRQMPGSDAERYRAFKAYREWRASEEGLAKLGPLNPTVVPTYTPPPAGQKSTQQPKSGAGSEYKQ